jgi:hypothetical protein
MPSATSHKLTQERCQVVQQKHPFKFNKRDVIAHFPRDCG